MKEQRLVLVQWVDSSGGGGWKDVREAVRDADENDLTCETAGWLIHETDHSLLIAPSRSTSTDRQVCDSMQIPRCAVVRVRSLAPGRTRR